MHSETKDFRGDVAPGVGTLPPGTDPDWSSDGAAWRDRAAELADWILQLVVRADAHGAHTISSDEEGRPVFRRTTCKSPLTHADLVRHFAAEDGSAVLGLHVTSPDEQGVLVVVDIDAHGNADDDPEKNRAFARHVYDEASRLGFVVLLLDSNGRGGYHVWIFLGQLTSMARAWRLGKFLVRDYARFGLAEPPETFPKRPHLTGKRFGHWIRIMGLHHKRPFWTRVWDERGERWEEGDAAVTLIVGTVPVPVDVAAVLPADFTGEPPRAEPADDTTARTSLDYGHRREVRLAEEALRYLRGGEVDRYGDWLEVGMCLAELGEDGLKIWDRWSRRSTKYRPGETREKWKNFQAGDAADPGTVGLGSLFRRAEAYGFRGHVASRRWADYQDRMPGVLDEGEDPGRLADEARDQRFSRLCDEAVAILEDRPDLRAELAASWGVSAATTRLIGAGLREDLEPWLDRYMPTDRWAVTVPLSSIGGLTVGYVRLYPGEVWRPKLGWDSRHGLILPWDFEARDGPVVVCADSADTARALELGGRAVGLAEPASPLDELVSFLHGDHAASRDIVVVPAAGEWANDTAYRLSQLLGRPVKVLALPQGARGLCDCINPNNTPESREEDKHDDE